MANSHELIMRLLAERQIEVTDNAAIARITPDTIHLEDGRKLPFKYAMVLPPFRGPRCLREAVGLTDAKGCVPVLPTYRHPSFNSILLLPVSITLMFP